MKKLYISDLDGTLLNKNVELSEYTVETLNSLISSGVDFSIATARTSATCDRILSRVAFNVPVVLMNGVLVYDMPNKKYIKKEIISCDIKKDIIGAMKRCDLTGLMYCLSEDTLSTYYEYIPNHAVKEFIDERVTGYGKKFTQISDFLSVTADTIYFCFIDSFENIHRLYDETKDIKGIRIEKYQDIYSDDGRWYMEVFAETASKYNAVLFLKEKFGYDRIIAFGDNLNDIPMFKASDECYAVENAKDEVKAVASGIIGKNTDDSVVKKIKDLENA